MINDKARKNKVLVSLKWVGDAMGQSPGTMLNHQDRAANGKNVIVLTKYSIYIYLYTHDYGTGRKMSHPQYGLKWVGLKLQPSPNLVVVHGMLFTYHIRWSIYPFRDHCPMNTSHPWKFANICQHLPASTGSSGLWHVATHHQVIPVLALPQLRRRHARQSRALRGVAQVRWCCWVLLSEVNDICSQKGENFATS